jgi:hypothetical protein
LKLTAGFIDCLANNMPSFSRIFAQWSHIQKFFTNFWIISFFLENFYAFRNPFFEIFSTKLLDTNSSVLIAVSPPAGQMTPNSGPILFLQNAQCKKIFKKLYVKLVLPF